MREGVHSAGFAFGNFYAEPTPQVDFRPLGRAWHWGKVLFERWWLSPPGTKCEAIGLVLSAGARWFNLPGPL
jgi:hypothetical protein